ncbi:hypothetical protein G7054_g2275 [Neopestalotiopsis clavispora]|nr:hypothetical protein G7054_g2275 [Neopestalotiopsis clavispora]
MVMIDGIPGLEAWVTVNDERALEYEPSTGLPKVEEVNPPTSTKYIQSISGATFNLYCKISPDFGWSDTLESQHRALGVYYKLDGKDGTDFHVIKMNQSQCVSHWFYELDFRRGRPSFKEFRFASVRTVESNDNDRIEKERAFASELGAIEIIVKRLVREKRTFLDQVLVGEDSSSESDSEDPPETVELTEKTLKGRAISNLTSFGSAQGVSALGRGGPSSDRPKRPQWDWKYYAKADERPFAIFRFLYRSIDDLRRELIVSPKTCSIAPIAQDPIPAVKEEEKEGEALADPQDKILVPRDPTLPIKEEAKGEETSIEDLSMEEIMQLARERLEQKKAEVKIKTEEKPTTKRPHDEIIDVEKEDSIRQSRKSRRRVFVDLTE